MNQNDNDPYDDMRIKLDEMLERAASAFAQTAEQLSVAMEEAVLHIQEFMRQDIFDSSSQSDEDTLS